MSVGVELLLADDIQHARQLAFELDSLNQARKEIEQGMKQSVRNLSEFDRTFTSRNYRWASYYIRLIGIKGVLGTFWLLELKINFIDRPLRLLGIKSEF